MSASVAQHHLKVVPERDYAGLFVAVAAFVASVFAFAITFAAGNVLSYTDAVSHMEIARRVIAGSEPDLAQLGSVWPMLPHVLMLPLVWIDPLYQSGIAGAIVSMVAYVVSCWLLYKIVRQLTEYTLAGIAAAVVFGVNVNVLYMQSTPMTELLLFATLLLVVYCLLLWADRRRYTYMIGAGVAAIAATLTRYESWIILPVLAVVAVVVAWRQSSTALSLRSRRRFALDRVIVFGLTAFTGVGFWLIWNLTLFGDAFAFQNGEYAKPSLWLTSSEPSIGNLALSAKVYLLAIVESVPLPLVAVAIVGVLMYVVKEMVLGKFAARSLIAPSFLVIIPFFIWAIYSGQRPLHVLQVNDDLYNTRFGLICVLPIAIFAGYAVGFIKHIVWRSVLASAIVALTLTTSVVWLQSGDIITLRDPQRALTSTKDTDQFAVVNFLRAHYGGGDTLIENFGNEWVMFALPSQHEVYEGTNRNDRWNQALVRPAANGIKVIIARSNPTAPDKVWKSLQAHPDALRGYNEVYNANNYHVYVLKNG